MSKNSNENGRAYEYACLKALHEYISKYRAAEIVEEEGYEAAKSAWNAKSEVEQKLSADEEQGSEDQSFENRTSREAALCRVQAGQQDDGSDVLRQRLAVFVQDTQCERHSGDVAEI